MLGEGRRLAEAAFVPMSSKTIRRTITPPLAESHLTAPHDDRRGSGGHRPTGRRRRDGDGGAWMAWAEGGAAAGDSEPPTELRTRSPSTCGSAFRSKETASALRSFRKKSDRGRRRARARARVYKMTTATYARSRRMPEDARAPPRTWSLRAVALSPVTRGTSGWRNRGTVRNTIRRAAAEVRGSR